MCKTWPGLWPDGPYYDLLTALHCITPCAVDNTPDSGRPMCTFSWVSASSIDYTPETVHVPDIKI